MVISPAKDGSRKPGFVEFWIEFEEQCSTNSKMTKTPDDPLARDFLRALARRSAQSWVKRAEKAKGW